MKIAVKLGLCIFCRVTRVHVLTTILLPSEMRQIIQAFLHSPKAVLIILKKKNIIFSGDQ